MNTMTSNRIGLSLVLALIVAVLPATASDRVVLTPAAGSEVKLEGTSNMHDWEAIGDRIDGSVEVEAAFLEDPRSEAVTSLRDGGPPPRVQVMIPVESLESDKRRLNRLMYDSLEAGDHPQIRYTLTSARLVDGEAEGDQVRLATEGELQVAGVTRVLEMEVLVERAAGNQLVVTGSVPLKMTDFGIDPPRALLGMLRTADELTATFRWVLEPTAGGSRR